MIQNILLKIVIFIGLAIISQAVIAVNPVSKTWIETYVAAHDQGPQGPQGPPGIQGSQGIQGELGPPKTAGTGISIVSDAISVTPHTIGETYGGGIIFYVYDNGRHGLIAATADQSTGIRWNAGANVRTRAKADNGVGAGKINTFLIIAIQELGTVTVPNYAARVCNEYSATVGGVTYSGWYLPSRWELNELYEERSEVPGLSGSYWSSTEDNDVSKAWTQLFPMGGKMAAGKSTTNRVRPIRAF